ncbi:MAG: metal-binding protein [Clostridiales bacterium]|nr:metal-binding protein [Clostridiales bacterium]HBM80490.1 metal-binding protein [Clostridiaceae bacterium]
MNTQDAMRYVESEYEIIRLTPCEICGGEYLQNYQEIVSKDDLTYDILTCVCSKCGHEKSFEFYAPYLDEIKKPVKVIKKAYN